MPEELNEEQKKELLALARAAVRLVGEKTSAPAPEARDPKLKEKRGVFVTLRVDGRLRGCIGHPLPVKPLDRAVVEVAGAAASEDYRFPPLRPEELDRLRIEISVLSRPRRMKNLRSIEVGRHGIIVSKGPHKGLLLPQVPVEYGWDRETFLSHGCLKAGLAEDEWKRGVNVEVFTAQVFSEDAGTGTVPGK